MTRRVKLQRREGVALITLPGCQGAADPGFDAALRQSLAGALDLALAEPGLAALVLRAAHSGPGAGAEPEPGPHAESAVAGWPCATDPVAGLLPDAATAPAAPGIAEIAARIAATPVPVIALLSGRIAGAGLALAQAAQLRMALAGTVIAAPEPDLGLIPGGGALVRLARRAGGAQALAWLASGRDWPAEEALKLGLCDAVSSGGAVETAVLGVALQAAQSPDPRQLPRMDRALADMATYLAALDEARLTLAPAFAAPGRGAALARAAEVLEAAALLPLDEALAMAEVTFDDLADSPESRALVHVARLRRAASGLAGLTPEGAPDPGPADPAPTDPAPADSEPTGPACASADWPRIALWNQPDRLALALLGAGHAVVLGASDPDQLEPAFTAIAAAQEAAVAEGRLDPEVREADWSRLGAATDLPGLLGGAPEPPGLVIATPRGAAEARALIDARAPGSLLLLEGPFGAASEQALRADLGGHRRGGFWDLHSVTPAGRAALPRVAALLRGAGASVIHGGPGAGVAALLEAAFVLAAERLVLAGASPAAVDGAARNYGFAEAPFARVDARGLGPLASLLRACGSRPGAYLTYLPLEGRVGRAGGIGVYAYGGPGATPTVPEGETDLLAALRAEAGITPRALPQAEIQARLLAELAGAGAAALQAGAAHRAGDIDLAAISVLGFPAHRGGPMFQADQAGLIALRKRLRALAEEGAPAPVTLWDVMIRNGRRWSDL